MFSGSDPIEGGGRTGDGPIRGGSSGDSAPGEDARWAEVPWLAKIPIAGFFFNQEGYADENKSLMILIRAHITDVKDELARLEGATR